MVINLNTLFEYLLWRGDLTFLESPLNEVDNIIFCAFSYFNIENLLDYQERISIKDLYAKYIIVEEDSLFKKNQNRLFQMLSESKRFQDILITHYFNEVDKEKEMQVSGLTFILPNDSLFVAFKGTDESLTGWKEDFDLSYKSIIPAQRKATQYLNEILSHTQRNVYVGGHSKGGNLAMYASIFCQDNDKIVRVYNNDGPGFNKEIVESKNYKIGSEKITTYIPKSSIVGNIFNKETKTIIVKSKQIGLLQHNLYSWSVYGNHFVYAAELSPDAKKISNALNDFLNKIPNSQKKKIISFLYELLESWNVSDLEDIVKRFLIPTSLLNKYHFNIEDLNFLWRILPIVIEILKRL